MVLSAAALLPAMATMLLEPPDIAPTVSTPSTVMTASMTLSAVAKASSLAVSSGTLTVIVSWLLLMSGIMTMPMVATRQTDTPSSAMASASGTALRRRQKRSSFS